MKKLFIILICSIGTLLTTDCERRTGNSVYSNITGEPFPADNAKDYRGYNPHRANDSLYRKYERDSVATSEIYDNSETSRAN